MILLGENYVQCEGLSSEKSRWVPTQLKTTLAAASQDYSQASLDLIQVTGPLPIGAQGREPSGARKGWRKR